MLGDILAGLQLYDRFKKKKPKNIGGTKDTLITRFVALFESHGINRSQIPEFFEHDLDIYTCSKDEELLKKLNPQILTDASTLFGINKDWLEGNSREIYKVKDFYKDPKKFELYIKNIMGNVKTKHIFAYILRGGQKRRTRSYDSLIVLTEPIGILNGREIYRYHLLGQWVTSYWKSRAFFTACCALLYKYQYAVLGYYVDTGWLVNIIDGEGLLKYDLNDREGGLDLPSRGSWIVADFVEIPDEFLQGMDSEGGRANLLAIHKWLELSDRGYMRCFTDDEAHADVEQFFRDKIEQL